MRQAISIYSENANVFIAVELEMWKQKNMAACRRRWKTSTLESVSLWLRNIQHLQSWNVCFNQTDLDFFFNYCKNQGDDRRTIY